MCYLNQQVTCILEIYIYIYIYTHTHSVYKIFHISIHQHTQTWSNGSSKNLLDFGNGVATFRMCGGTYDEPPTDLPLSSGSIVTTC